MLKFLHMHNAMANKAYRIEASESDDFWNIDRAKLREIVMSGKADYVGNRIDVVQVTEADRKIVCDYLGV